MTKVAELYGRLTSEDCDWKAVSKRQHCPFLGRKCLKNRKSEPESTIGSCSMIHGRTSKAVMICPFRLLERSQIFTDCIHLLGVHEPGNELRIVTELHVPGGSIDYCLVSVRDGKPRDFVGIELQTLDTTGTVWPERQRFLRTHGVPAKAADLSSTKPFGMNWKMTAKTILMQLHHKIETFEHLGKRLVLVVQDCLLDYMQTEFKFNHMTGNRDGDAMQFHAYELKKEANNYLLRLNRRLSTDAAGVAACLHGQSNARVELVAILERIEAKLPNSTLLTVGGGSVPVPKSADEQADE